MPGQMVVVGEVRLCGGTRAGEIGRRLVVESGDQAGQPVARIVDGLRGVAAGVVFLAACRSRRIVFKGAGGRGIVNEGTGGR